MDRCQVVGPCAVRPTRFSDVVLVERKRGGKAPKTLTRASCWLTGSNRLRECRIVHPTGRSGSTKTPSLGSLSLPFCTTLQESSRWDSADTSGQSSSGYYEGFRKIWSRWSSWVGPTGEVLESSETYSAKIGHGCRPNQEENEAFSFFSFSLAEVPVQMCRGDHVHEDRSMGKDKPY